MRPAASTRMYRGCCTPLLYAPRRAPLLVGPAVPGTLASIFRATGMLA